MSKHQMLNNIDHKDLKIITEKSAFYGNAVGGALVFPAEFLEVHKEYPIYFQKSADSGEFQAVALFGFKKDENLFLSESGWQARYIPAIIQREPFLIGFSNEAHGENKQAMIHINMDSPRISSDDKGVAVFLESGGNSPYLQEVNKSLQIVHEGLSAIKDMFQVFSELDLIEPFALDIEFNDGSQYKTSVFYTLHREKLHDLSDEILGKLHRAGYLQCAFMVIESMSNLEYLIDRKNSLLNT